MKEKKEIHPSLKKEKTAIYKMLLCAFALFCFTAVANAAVNVQIDSPNDKSNASLVRLRPQVVAAGFDPILLDFTTMSFKIVAMVREGAFPIQDVLLIINGNDVSMGMNFQGKLPNGDLIYESTFMIGRGDAFSMPTLFGPDLGQVTIMVRDLMSNKHSFPFVEYGENPPITSSTKSSSATEIEYNPIACKRSLPQVIMGGVDPPLIDVKDSSLDVIAVVRDGEKPILDVALTMGNEFSLLMTLREELPNGDKLYKVTLLFPKGSFSAPILKELWGSNDNQFMIKVRDNIINNIKQFHSFPDLRRGNYPAINQDECLSEQH